MSLLAFVSRLLSPRRARPSRGTAGNGSDLVLEEREPAPEIIFTPLSPAAARSAPGLLEGSSWTCPVTRQTISPGMPLFQCSDCKMVYSVEGWQFLRRRTFGQCCGCRKRGVVRKVEGRAVQQPDRPG